MAGVFLPRRVSMSDDRWGGGRERGRDGAGGRLIGKYAAESITLVHFHSVDCDRRAPQRRRTCSVCSPLWCRRNICSRVRARVFVPASVCVCVHDGVGKRRGCMFGVTIHV